jgi:hypothetical protein
MRRFAQAGFFPLGAAASAAKREALSMAAGLQTYAGLFAMFISFAYGGVRGFGSERTRGWSDALWMSSLSIFVAGRTLFGEISAQTLDYLISSSSAREAIGPFAEIYGAEGLNAQMLPGAFLLERGAFAAVCVGFFTVLGHDLGYRLREALEDFGLVEQEEMRRPRPTSQYSGTRRAADAPEAEAKTRFGHRADPPPPNAPMSAEALARAVLGVGAGASQREIERAYRAQMKRAHPDHGGSVERAAALNAARDVLQGRR